METPRLPDAKSRRRLNELERVQEFRREADAVGALAADAVQKRDLALACIHAAFEARLALGVRLTELRERFAGDFDDWLGGYCSQHFSRASAYRWMAKIRDLKIALGKDEPTFEELKRAQLAAETLPEPIGSGSSTHADPPPFRLRLEIPGSPEKWEPGVRREFIAQAKRVVELYHRVLAIEDAA